VQRKAVIVVADNDSNPAESFDLVQKQIRDAEKWGVPTKPREGVKLDELPPVSVLMLPWDDVPGSIDTICFAAAARKRPEVAACVEAFVRCVKAEGWDVHNASKLRLRCLLSAACKDNPNTGLPRAWSTEKGRPGDLVPLDDECFNEIATFLAGFH
jgi:hypothetical protein